MKNSVKLTILKKKVMNRLSHYFSFINPNATILNFLDKNFSYIVEKYKNAEPQLSLQSENKETHQTIWQFWWQGYETAPILVKKCIDSVKAHANGAKVILLTEKNWRDYAEIPEYIVKKVKSGKISLTHFSDILRMVLLSKHGGLWLDATIFVSCDIPDEWFSAPYFSIHYKTSTSKIAKGRWTGFCQSAQKGSLIHSFCRDVFFDYWKKYDKLVDYFLIDYVMDFGYENISEFKRLVDSLPLNNECVKELDKHFSDVYSDELVSSILSKSTFFKLNWKREYKTLHNDCETIYAHFMNTNRGGGKV